MAKVTVGLANVRFPVSHEESLEIVLSAIKQAARESVEILCFPENIIPGYRPGTPVIEPTQSWLEEAWVQVDAKAREANVCVILGTERVDGEKRMISARVTGTDGTVLGFQDKVQLDPSEDAIFSPGVERRIFQYGDLVFGIVICHEGWRYPETVRWAARHGAQIAFHPHVEVVEDESYIPKHFADPKNSFHEKAALCRAAENGCYFATVNCALPGSTTTSAFVDPDGNLIKHQPYGQEGILICEIDTQKAQSVLPGRLRPEALGFREI